MNAPQSVDRKTFLANVRQSKLISDTQLSDTLSELPTSARGRAVARALVEKKLLTRFQAERLLAGRNTGFLLGQYRILDQLGQGGMGRVFKAEHLAMKRVVAIKVLAPKLVQSDRARELFLREVQAAAQLVHPNVVAAFDAGEADGRFFLVLEFVDGPNLDQLVREKGPLPVGLACEYIKQTAKGLQAAHELGMVHRDIKPANLLVQRGDRRKAERAGLTEQTPGIVKISDFGLARLQSPASDTMASDLAGTICVKQYTVMGTPDFLSPEQARDLHATDIRSDLYSLGCTFYFLLTAQTPFAGGTALEKLIRHNSEAPPPLENFRSDVPALVIEIVNCLLSKDADDRFQEPCALAEALEPFTVGVASPWGASPTSSAPSFDTAPTPMGEVALSSANILEGGSSAECSALQSTDVPAPSPTSLGTMIRPYDFSNSHGLSRGQRIALLCLSGITVLLFAALAILMAFV